MSERMRLSSVVTEVLSNLRGYMLLAVTSVIVALGVGLGVVSVTANEVNAIVRRQSDMIAAGATVFSVVATDGGTVSAARCDAANTVTGVVAAGAVVATTFSTADVSASRRVPLSLATPGFVAIVWPGTTAPSNGGVVVGPSYAQEFGQVEGGLITLSGIPLVTHVPFEGSARFEVLNTQMVTPIAASTGETRECFVEAAPQAMGEVERLLTQWFDPMTPTHVSRLMPDLDLNLEVQALAGRISRYAGLAGGAVLVLTTALAWAVRRREFGLYQLLDRSRRTRTALVVVETLALVVIPVSVGVAFALALVQLDSMVAIEATTIELLKLASVTLALPAAGYAIVSSGGAVSILKQA